MAICACRTPLHAAAFAEDVAGLQLVLRHGAEINAVDKSGRSALMVAADKGHSGSVGKSNTPSGLSVRFFRAGCVLKKVTSCSTFQTLVTIQTKLN